MNTALKHWKEAATIILAAGSRHKRAGPGSAPCRSSPGGGDPGPGLTRHLPPGSGFDYDVLMLKRSSKSGFMPNAYVFPGGVVHPADFSGEWLEVFAAFRNDPDLGLGKVRQPAGTRPPIFATDRLMLGSPLPGEVAFRICALRETFEESGVLLAVAKPEERSLVEAMEKNRGTISSPPGLACQVEDRGALVRWRALVNQNPANFIRMCKELDLLPNIWALHEWGNWLTPVGVDAKKRRYDTAFFLCCLREAPHTLQDNQEIVHVKWATPPEFLHSFESRELWIAPPQFYDLSRMCRHPSMSSLHRFAVQRATEGCEHWLPVVIDSGRMSLLPGDRQYPEDGSEELKEDTAYLQDSSGKESGLHRFVIHDPYTMSVQATITPKYKHLLPVEGPVIRNSRL